MSSEAAVTRLLHAYVHGDRSVSDQLFGLVYQELRTIAHRQLGRMRPGETLVTTALVHEAYLKLFERADLDLNDRNHFLSLMARAMRQIVVDYSRRSTAEKRGGDAARTVLQTAMLQVDDMAITLIDLDNALQRLGELNPRLVQVVELRFFGGFSIPEIAGILEVNARTVDRDWYKAKSLLYMMLAGPET